MGVKMDRREFIEKLQRTLAGGLDSVQVAENVRYYQEYIESEIQKGNTEGAVLSQLGDPRLLAKSIIEANKHAGASYGSNQEYDEEVTEDVITEDKKFGRGYGRSIIFAGLAGDGHHDGPCRYRDRICDLFNFHLCSGHYCGPYCLC